MANLTNNLINLAFEQAKINLGSTKNNPSVGCIIEKNGSVISSGCTSINGRPHAEFNALNKKKNFKGANLYTTLEPCTHFGKTPPCTNIISKKKIKSVFFSVNDFDLRTKNKAKKILKNKKIKVYGGIGQNFGKKFYQSYRLQHSYGVPLIDAKIAISKDNFSIDKKNKWLTNIQSRKRSQFLRSNYSVLLTTSKTINNDNPRLNCRISGIENKTPDLIIIDRNLKININAKIFKIRRKIYLMTTSTNLKKTSKLKKKNVKVIYFNKLNTKDDFKKVFKKIHNLDYSRVFVESGTNFLNFLIKNNFLSNLFIFQNNRKLAKNGLNPLKETIFKSISKKNYINVNLFGDKIHKINLK